MTKIAPTASPLALAAILAASAIPSTAFAQDAATAPAAPAAQTPVIVLPPVDAPPPAPEAASPPVQQAAPTAPIVLPDVSETRASAPASSATRTTSARNASAPTTRSSSPAAPSSQPAAGAASETVPTTTVPPGPVSDAAMEPAAPPVAADPAPVAAQPVAPANDGGSLVPFALGGLVLGGGIAAAAMASRRRRTAKPFQPQVARKPVAQRDPEVAPAAAIPVAADRAVGAAPAARKTSAKSVRLPSGPVPTGEKRQALIERMVAAQPDESNPFRSRKTRRKRARILVAAHEHRQREAATEPFDFRTYTPFSKQEAARGEGVAPYREKASVN